MIIWALLNESKANRVHNGKYDNESKWSRVTETDRAGEDYPALSKAHVAIATEIYIVATEVTSYGNCCS